MPNETTLSTTETSPHTKYGSKIASIIYLINKKFPKTHAKVGNAIVMVDPIPGERIAVLLSALICKSKENLNLLIGAHNVTISSQCQPPLDIQSVICFPHFSLVRMRRSTTHTVQ